MNAIPALLLLSTVSATSLSCVSPNHPQRIAGASIEFLARLTTHTNAPLEMELDGSFDGGTPLRLFSTTSSTATATATATTKTRNSSTTTTDITWSLAGFMPGVHTYTLWTTVIPNANTDGKPLLISCDGSFETVHFPGWDSYVQSFYNTTKTIEQLNEQPDSIARVGRLNFSVNSFERLNDLLGPQLIPSIKATTLFVTFAGKNSIDEINQLALRITSDPTMSFMLFAYDRTNWAQFDWVDKAIVVTVTGTMKWRFVKTFLHPDIIRAYAHLIIMDEDCSIEHLNITLFLSDMKRDNVMIGQPSNGEGSYGSHEVVRQQIGRNTVFTNFAECGPFITFDTNAWPCVYDILQSDVTCGYGYDLMWSHCGATAVLHQHFMVHENRKPASSRPNFVMRCAAEGMTLFQRLAFKGLAPFDPSEL